MGIEQLGAMLSGGGRRRRRGYGGSSNQDFQMMKLMMEQAQAQERARRIAALSPDLFGTPGGVTETEVPFEQDLFPGEKPIQGLRSIEKQVTEPTGLYALDLTPEQRFVYDQQRAMIESGIPALQEQALKDRNIMMRSVIPEKEKISLSASAKIARDMGFTPGTPEFQAKVEEIYKFRAPRTNVNVNTAAKMGQAGERVPHKLAERLVDKDGNPYRVGVTWGEVEATGGRYKETSAAEKGRLATEAANVVVDEFDRLLLGTKENPGILSGVGVEGGKSRFEFFADATKGLITQEDPRYAEYLAARSSLSSFVARSLGESGALATEDVARVQAILPNLFTDGETVARAKLKLLRRIINRGVQGDKEGAKAAITELENMGKKSTTRQAPNVTSFKDGKTPLQRAREERERRAKLKAGGG